MWFLPISRLKSLGYESARAAEKSIVNTLKSYSEAIEDLSQELYRERNPEKLEALKSAIGAYRELLSDVESDLNFAIRRSLRRTKAYTV